MPVCALPESRGINIYHELHGPIKREWTGDQERFVLLILGSVADLRKTTDKMYIRQVEGYFKVLTYDHRNTGQTTSRDEPCTMEDYGDDAAALLQTIVPDKLPVDVVAVSFGGMVAQHLAIRHPHLVRKLVLCACSTGGPGGNAFPVHEWYAPGVTPEQRVESKAVLSNKLRTEEWKAKNKSEWGMITTIMGRDENIGKDEPLRLEGYERQFQARRAHNTWDQIGSLSMPVLVLGSPADGLCPVDLCEALAARIGPNAETRFDFEFGHSFLAADLKTMTHVNEWLRKPMPPVGFPQPSPAAARSAGRWKVIGGGDAGGILVRVGIDLKSEQREPRLSTGAIIETLSLEGVRLQYRLLEGTGPATGWVSTKLKDKDLVVPVD
eukprot:NODE_10048_length_1380_cov_6.169992.p1 GENE.NODE_10048_length_1380_cov_6.169992~~NODE_10048_length_1380_cov_6.169992.p1  ORF type:complete len:381 (-),score=70.30 NODE_10048_length_1380_cov_6.169992:125-1267(-)